MNSIIFIVLQYIMFFITKIEKNKRIWGKWRLKNKKFMTIRN